MTAAVAWREVEDRLRPFVARRVSAADVDDVLQDVFLRMHRGLGGLRDDQQLGAWLYQVARSAIAEQGRARARHPLAAGADPPELPVDPAAAEHDDRQAARALAGCLSAFVARLPSPYREAVTLVELEGLTAREAAELTGISVSGMKSRVQRGRAQLRHLLEQCCDIELDARGKVSGFTPVAIRRIADQGGACCATSSRPRPERSPR
ncbi:MAG TPA: sigma-70 family RNA polymerase sigma factor [Kofleriaceae bacterium]|jgi:RNA polymerase sigma-70 factor (ECF subfamily)|nr:sigma-70 family RNA polymerase sigma factor [Kofleriaceae bacterium]